MSRLPSKKRVKNSTFMDCGDWGDCLLHGNTLYVLKNIIAEDGSQNFLFKRVDLSSSNVGDFSYSDIELPQESEGIAIGDGGDNFYVLGKMAVFYRKEDVELLFSDTHDKPSRWRGVSSTLLLDNILYRYIDGENPDLGIDIYDVCKKEVVGHIDDIKLQRLKGVSLGVVSGVTVGGVAVIYDLPLNMPLIECPLSNYFSVVNAARARFAKDDEVAVITYYNRIFVFDLASKKEIYNIDCAALPVCQEVFSQLGRPIRYLDIKGVSCHSGKVLVYGSDQFPFMLCIDLATSTSWVFTEGRALRAQYSGGSLIFGVNGADPTAWDIDTGKQVWEGKGRVSSYRIQVSDSWLVYSALNGSIACFKRTKPYIRENNQ